MKDSTHSGDGTALDRLLLIAPIGVYLGRVRTGIDLVLAGQTKAKTTKVRVILAAGENWINEVDPSGKSYKREFVDTLKDYVLRTWRDEAQVDIVCDSVVLPWEDEEYLAGWLLKVLSDFFGSSRAQAEAFIDLTSAPKEWQLATIDVSNFFANMELYYVKPKMKKGPFQYAYEEVEDKGHPRLETVRTSVPRQPLPQWLNVKDDNEEPNVQYILYKTIFELAKNQVTSEQQDSADELAKVWVPLEQEAYLNEYRKRLRETLGSTDRDATHLKKSISKYLTSVEPFRLFEVRGKSVRMTLRAAMVGQSLFGSNKEGKPRH